MNHDQFRLIMWALVALSASIAIVLHTILH